MDSNLSTYKKKNIEIYKFFGNISLHKVLSLLILIIKLLPIIVVTHDWKISSKFGISYYFRKFTLSEIIFNCNNLECFNIILFLVFLLIVINCIIFVKVKFFNKSIYLYRSFLIKTTFILYSFNPYFYSIFTEIIFNKNIKKDVTKGIYILQIIIICICIIILLFLDIIISSVLIEESNFIGCNSFLTNELGKLDFSSISYSLIQIVIQLEYNIKEDDFIKIKILIRIMICFLYICYFLDHSLFYYRFKYDVCFRFYYTICFSSCIIEFFFLKHYYDNKTFILQEDKACLVIKIFVEIILAIILILIYYKIEFNKISKHFSEFNSKRYESYNNNILKVFNLLYYMDRPNELKTILNKFNNTLKTKVHNPKCPDNENKCFYCKVYDYEKFDREIDYIIEYMKHKKELMGENINLKEKSPILFQYFINQFENISLMNIPYTKKFYNIASILVTFCFAFERKYFKCLYMIETIFFNISLKRNFYSNLQLSILKTRVNQYYKNDKEKQLKKVHLNDDNEHEVRLIFQFIQNFNSSNKLLKIENRIKNLLISFQKIMKIFNEEDISFSYYSLLIKQFFVFYTNYIEKLKELFNKINCTIYYPIKKISTPFEFLLGETPKNIIKSMNKFFANQISIKDSEKEIFIITMYVNYVNEHFFFKPKYISDDLVKKLKYSKNEFLSLNFVDIFPKIYSKSYNYLFGFYLSNGVDYLNIKDFCLQDKYKYISFYEMKGDAISTQKGIQLYIQLEKINIDKLLKRNKSIHMKTNNDNNDKNLAGTCFFFTNKSGKITNISRGFEDYLFLNSKILSRYKISILDIFKIKKLKKKGVFEIELLHILNNINDKFMRENGQITEDEFSKIIIKLRNFQDTIIKVKFDFIVNGIYEQRKFIVGKDKEKKFYIFSIVIKLKESKRVFQESSIIYLEKLIAQNIKKSSVTHVRKDTNIDTSTITNLEEITSTPQVFDRESRFWFLLKKVKNVNKLCIILLKKYFNIALSEKKKEKSKEIEDEKTIKDQEDKEILNYNEMSKKSLKASFMIKLHSFTFIGQYLPSVISVLFYLVLIIMFIFKLKQIIILKKYVSAFGEGNMFIQIVNHISIKVLLMQYSANGVQEEMLNEEYNNSWEYNNNLLTKRYQEYIIYHSRFFEFISTDSKARKNLFSYYNARGNYSIPLINGTKSIIENQIFQYLVHVILNPIKVNGKISILYNKSDYYFNEEMINKSNLNNTDYFIKAYAYVEFLENFSLFFTYIASESQNIFFNKIIGNEITIQKKLSLVILFITIAFSIFSILQFFLFLSKTSILFSNYYLGYIRLRFFNNYINLKINFILDFIDNYSKEKNIHTKMDEIEIIQNNIEEIVLHNIMTDQYDKYRAIKVQPIQVKNISHQDKEYKEKEKEIIENKNEMNELSKNFSQSKYVDSPKLFNILKKQTSYNISNIQKKSAFNSNINLHRVKRNSLQFKSNDFLPNVLSPNRENRESTNNKSTASNNNPTNSNVTNISNVTNKSNVNLIGTSTRSSISGKSTLKLLNESKNNVSNNKSVSKNQLIQSEKEKELQKKFLNSGKKLLEKPILYFNFLLFLSIMIICFITVTLMQIILSIKIINTTKSITHTEYDIFLFLKYNIQVVFLYGLMVLKNEPIYFEYYANQYTSDCINVDQKMTNTYNHNIFEELLVCYFTVKSKLEQIPSGKINRHLLNVKKIHSKFYSKEFCETFANFIIKNKDNSFIKELSYLENDTYDSLYYDCSNLGNGINSEGYNTAIDTISNTLISYYEDFNGENRTEKSNFERLNDSFFITCILETMKITKKLSIIYFILFQNDFENYKNYIIKLESILFAIQIFVMLIITISYIIHLKKFERETEKVNFFNKCLINSILYK